MSLETRLQELIAAIGPDIKALQDTRGILANLTTDAKDDLVSAINELDAAIEALQTGAAGIDDGVVSTTTTWSSQKTTDEIAQAIANLIGGASAGYQTLAELQALLEDQDDAVAALVASIANRLRFDQPQSLTEAEKAQGNENLGSLSLVQSGDVDVDLVALYNQAKA